MSLWIKQKGTNLKPLAQVISEKRRIFGGRAPGGIFGTFGRESVGPRDSLASHCAEFTAVEENFIWKWALRSFHTKTFSNTLKYILELWRHYIRRKRHSRFLLLFFCLVFDVFLFFYPLFFLYHFLFKNKKKQKKNLDTIYQLKYLVI